VPESWYIVKTFQTHIIVTNDNSNRQSSQNDLIQKSAINYRLKQKSVHELLEIAAEMGLEIWLVSRKQIFSSIPKRHRTVGRHYGDGILEILQRCFGSTPPDCSYLATWRNLCINQAKTTLNLLPGILCRKKFAHLKRRALLALLKSVNQLDKPESVRNK